MVLSELLWISFSNNRRERKCELGLSIKCHWETSCSTICLLCWWYCPLRWSQPTKCYYLMLLSNQIVRWRNCPSVQSNCNNWWFRPITWYCHSIHSEVWYGWNGVYIEDIYCVGWLRKSFSSKVRLVFYKFFWKQNFSAKSAIVFKG